MFLTDTGEYRWEAYHQPGDVPEQLDSHFMHQVTRAATATVLELERL